MIGVFVEQVGDYSTHHRVVNCKSWNQCVIEVVLGVIGYI